ncbi:MAG TPA: DUF5691 domain-containing protein [Chitinophagaceae bacterium]|nr:DUF5691 domain-containing protein [Chitinophagaceae bacterium]
MEFWKGIINTAMMGTDKKTIGAGELPAAISEAAASIQAQQAADKEEQFLQVAALAFNYRQCGVQPLKKEGISLPLAAAEEKAYCSLHSLQALKDILSEESVPLLKLWLQYCAASNKIVLPEMLPALLSAGVQEKKLQTLITACCGKRAEWLSGFNPAWDFSSHQTAIEQWQTGTPEQRKTVLANTRKVNPLQAREWLQQTWAQEDAASKLSFLELLAINISEADIDFLSALASEKSKKVKDAALELLKQTPGSPIVLQYQALLAQSVLLKKEKVLLGLGAKTALQFQLPPVMDDAVFTSGVVKLSNDKSLTDDEFIFFQLIQSVPPAFWGQHLAASPEDVIHYFHKDAVGKKMIPALVRATRTFNNRQWAMAMAQHSEVFYIDLLPLLPLAQQESYSIKFFEQYADSIIGYAEQREEPWSVALTKLIFKHAANNPYQYNRSFYNRNIHLVPGRVALELEKCTPADATLRSSWSNTSDYILKLLQLTAQTIQSFNSAA